MKKHVEEALGQELARRKVTKRETPEQVKRKRFITVWWGLRDAYGA